MYHKRCLLELAAVCERERQAVAKRSGDVLGSGTSLVFPELRTIRGPQALALLVTADRLVRGTDGRHPEHPGCSESRSRILAAQPVRCGPGTAVPRPVTHDLASSQLVRPSRWADQQSLGQKIN